jgi:excisionase family DNA binding protein
MPVFYTQKEAAEYLRCSEKTIQRHRSKGVLPYQRLGDHVKIRKEHLDALLTEPPPEASAPTKSWISTRWTEDAAELPQFVRRLPSRRAEAA